MKRTAGWRQGAGALARMAACAVLLQAGACGGSLGGENSELGDGAVVDASSEVVADSRADGPMDGTADRQAPLEAGDARYGSDATDARVAADAAGDVASGAVEAGRPGDAAADAEDAAVATGDDAAPEAAAPGDATTNGPSEAGVDAGFDASLGADEGPAPTDDGGDAGISACVDVNDDPHNCGVCGHDCLGGGCSAGVCLPIVLYAPAEGFPSMLALQAGRLYWVDTTFNSVLSVSVDGGDTTLVASPDRPTAVAVNAGAVYWVTDGTLQSLPFGATTPTTLGTGGSGYGLALSATDAYWTAIGTDALGNAMGSVFSVPLAGGPVAPMSTTENVPTQIVVAPPYAYWIDLNTQLPYGTTSLMQAPLAGGPPVAVVPTTAMPQTNEPDAITTYGSNVYFTIGGTLYSLPIGGTQPTLLATNVNPTALAVDGSGIYATTRGEILYVPLTGGIATPLAQGLDFPAGIALDERAIYFTDAEVVMKLAKPPAPSAADAGAPTGPPDDDLITVLAQCSGARDVLYVNQTGPSSAGGVPLGVSMNTNLDATWTSSAGSLSMGASATAAIGVLGGGGVTVSTVPGIPLVPGVVYPQPINMTVPRPFLSLQLIDVIFTSDTVGSFRIADMQVNPAGTGLTSFLVSFDLAGTGPSASRFLGCLRYSADPVDPSLQDGVTVQGPPILDGVSGAGLLAPCAGGSHFYLERTGGYPGVPGVTDLTAAKASFAASDPEFGIPSSVDMNARVGNSTWEIDVTPVPNGLPVTGVYSTSDPAQPTIFIGEVPGGGCPSSPTGSYGISELVMSPTNPSQVLGMQLWFDLQCAGAGALRGCAIYGN